jgi:ubiquinone/menaquinone biosynthesis C-methylase UbiE
MSSAIDWSAVATDVPRHYDEYLVPAMFVPLSRAVADAVEAAPGDTVLDVGCGSGVLSRELARRVAPDGSVVGCDPGEGMLAVARGHASAIPISYVLAGAEQLPFPDGAFSVVTCQQALQFFPDRPAAVTEFRRVLAAGGRLAVACWCSIEGTAGMRAVAEALDRHIGRKVGDMMRAPFVIEDPAELRTLLESAGFSDIVVEIERIEARYPTPEQFAPRTIAAGPIAPVFAAATDQQRAAITADVAAALAPYVDEGVAVFEAPSLIAVARV